MAAKNNSKIANIFLNPWEVVVLLFLPLSGFLLGMTFQSYVNNINQVINALAATYTQSVPAIQNICKIDADCKLVHLPVTNDISTCCTVNCLDYGNASVISVNANWYQSQKVNVCGQQRACPQVALLCTTQVMQNRTKFHASCIQNTCLKNSVN